MKSLIDAIYWLTRTPTFKFFLIGFLILLLLIPLFIAQGLVDERQNRSRQVQNEIGQLWGKPQRITGPFLVIPFSATKKVKRNGKTVEETYQDHAIFLPEVLNIDGNATTEKRQRSIFEVTVYSGKLALKGRFASPSFANLSVQPKQIHWRKAILTLAISDVSGLKRTVDAKIGAANYEFRPSIGLPRDQMHGIHVPLNKVAELFSTGAPNQTPGVDINPTQLNAFEFAFALDLAGSRSISFAPVARTTSVKFSSPWPHPSFDGGFLPETRNISDTGFDATWNIPDLARSVPNAWVLSQAHLNRFSPYDFGVKFYIPLDFYDLIERATKYGLLFLAIAFAGVFVMELVGGTRVHAVQYLFVGLAMTFFYVLLLSFAEHIGFAKAYALAAFATGGMLALYVGMAVGSFLKGAAMLVLFTVLYGLLYLILQLEDYALLAGAIFGFVMLTAVMFLTLRVDWSGAENTSPEQDRA